MGDSGTCFDCQRGWQSTEGVILDNFSDGSGKENFYNTDGEFNETLSVYDPFNKLRYIQQKNVVDREVFFLETFYWYDESGNLLKTQDPKGFITLYSYNNINQLTNITYSDKTMESFRYDPNGNQIYKKDAKGNVSDISYDYAGRITSIDVQNRTEEDVQYVYDEFHSPYSKGRLTTLKNANETRKFYYNASGLAVKNDVELTCGLSGQHFIIENQYTGLDLLKNLKFGKVGNLKEFSLQYDSWGRKTSLTASGEANPLVSAVMDKNSAILELNYQNGTKNIRSFDKLGRVTLCKALDPASKVLFLESYLYDNAGNRTKMINEKGDIVQYDYDSLNQLIYVNYGKDNVVRYQFDKNGNRTSMTTPYNSFQYTYDTDSDQLVSYVENKNLITSLTFDLNGNTEKESVYQGASIATGRLIKERTYNWLKNDQLSSINFNNKEANGLKQNKSEMKYNASGLRVRKDVNGKKRYNLVLGQSTPLCEVDDLGNIDKYNLFFSGLNVQLTSTGEKTFFHQDVLGSTRKTTDATGNETLSGTYDSYGKIESASGKQMDNLMFTGKEIDFESDLTYLGARYYNSTIGRWLTKDLFAGQVENPITLNRYIYCYNNPFSFTDTTGTVGHRTGNFFKKEGYRLNEGDLKCLDACDKASAALIGTGVTLQITLPFVGYGIYLLSVPVIEGAGSVITSVSGLYWTTSAIVGLQIQKSGWVLTSARDFIFGASKQKLSWKEFEHALKGAHLTPTKIKPLYQEYLTLWQNRGVDPNKFWEWVAKFLKDYKVEGPAETLEGNILILYRAANSEIDDILSEQNATEINNGLE